MAIATAPYGVETSTGAGAVAHTLATRATQPVPSRQGRRYRTRVMN